MLSVMLMLFMCACVFLANSSVLSMVGQAQIDIASQMSQYEISVMHDIIQDLNTMLEVRAAYDCTSS